MPKNAYSSPGPLHLGQDSSRQVLGYNKPKNIIITDYACQCNRYTYRDRIKQHNKMQMKRYYKERSRSLLKSDQARTLERISRSIRGRKNMNELSLYNFVLLWMYYNSMFLKILIIL